MTEKNVSPEMFDAALAIQFDGLAACVKAIADELGAASGDSKKFQRRMALAAAAEIRRKTAGPEMESKRNLMMVWIARTFDVPVGLLMGQ